MLLHNLRPRSHPSPNPQHPCKYFEMLLHNLRPPNRTPSLPIPPSLVFFRDPQIGKILTLPRGTPLKALLCLVPRFFVLDCREGARGRGFLPLFFWLCFGPPMSSKCNSPRHYHTSRFRPLQAAAPASRASLTITSSPQTVVISARTPYYCFPHVWLNPLQRPGRCCVCVCGTVPL